MPLLKPPPPPMLGVRAVAFGAGKPILEQNAILLRGTGGHAPVGVVDVEAQQADTRADGVLAHDGEKERLVQEGFVAVGVVEVQGAVASRRAWRSVKPSSRLGDFGTGDWSGIGRPGMRIFRLMKVIGIYFLDA